MPINPWLQRTLIGVIGGAIATAAQLAGARDATKVKRRRVGKKKVPIGTVARREARGALEEGMSGAAFREGLQQVPDRVTGLFTGKRPASPPADDQAVVDDGHSDGAPMATDARGKEENPASLWESARESARQVVGDTVVNDPLKRTVDKLGLKPAVDAIGKAGGVVAGAVKATAAKASDVARDVGGSIRESGLDEKVAGTFKAAGSAAARAFDEISQSIREESGSNRASTQVAKTTDDAATDAKTPSLRDVEAWLVGPGGPQQTKPAMDPANVPAATKRADAAVDDTPATAQIVAAVLEEDDDPADN